MPDEKETLVNQKPPGDDIPFGENTPAFGLAGRQDLSNAIQAAGKPTAQAETIADPQKEIWWLQEENKRLMRKVRTYEEEEAIRAKGERQSAVSAKDCFLAIIQGQAIRGDFTVGSPNFKGDISVATAAKNAAGVAAYMASAAKEARI